MKKAFFDGSPGLARYDVVKYPQFEKLTQSQLGFFWRPEEVPLPRDQRDFRELSDHEQHIFTSNLKRQILLDSVQGRAPAEVLAPLTSLSEIESFIMAWTFFETIHSRSYTHIIRNVYPNPSAVFDEIMEIPEIQDCSKDINYYYDVLASDPNKENLWLCLVAINALEGLRFYASFACSWAFAELGKMEGNAKIIKLIARDENLHLAFTQQLLKLLPKDDPEFGDIAAKNHDKALQIYSAVAEQEKAWAKYLFKDGSIIGLNEDLLCTYLEWLANKRATAIGLPSLFPSVGATNPLPWTQKWIGGADVQVAPQETPLTSYRVGGIKNDITEDVLASLKL